jgi:repressor LexA
MTQKEISKKVGVSSSTLTRYESCENINIRRNKIIKLADTLQIPSAELAQGMEISIESIPNIQPALFLKRIPVYGSAMEGSFSLKNENIIGYELFEVEDPENHFFLKVIDDSMNGARICKGDFALIKKKNNADNGKIVSVMIDGKDAILRRLKYSVKGIAFIAENSYYEPVFVAYDKLKVEPDYVRIIGELKGFIFKLR